MLEKYWIQKCGGWEQYTNAPIFHQQEQSISRERKMAPSAKRKADFAAAQTEQKQKSKKKKAPMTVKVSVVCLALFYKLVYSNTHSLISPLTLFIQ